jgi:uridine kinase
VTNRTNFSVERANVLEQLAKLIALVKLPHPTRVAIDGRTGSGKTTFANELGKVLQDFGHDVIRTSIDGFHRPRSERYARGRLSPEGYYYDARDLAAIRNLLLDPLGAMGNRRYRTASFDLYADLALEQSPIEAASDAILVVDGTFLQRSDLRDGWDLTVFLETSEDVAEQRGLSRDLLNGGGDQALMRDLYAQRYRPAYKIYEKECRPVESADAVVKNDTIARPVLTVRPDGRLREGGCEAR